MNRFACLLIKGYRLFLSPLLGSCCRFEPSCSQYALDAFEKKPFLIAFWMTVKRVVKCNPWHPGGKDPIE